MKVLSPATALLCVSLCLPQSAFSRVGEKVGDFIARVEKGGGKRVSHDPHPSGMVAYSYELKGKTIMVFALEGLISAERHSPVTKDEMDLILDAQGSGKWVKVRPDLDFYRDASNPALVANLNGSGLFITDGKATKAMEIYNEAASKK